MSEKFTMWVLIDAETGQMVIDEETGAVAVFPTRSAARVFRAPGEVIKRASIRIDVDLTSRG